MKGTLSEGVLPGLLRELYVGRKTGLLRFTRGDERRSVRVRHGHIVHATSNVKEERLGETLVRHGLLNQVDLDRATEIVLRDKKRLGLALQELGVFDKAQLEDAMAVHVREMLLKVFEWNEGEYAFEEQAEEAPDQDEDLTLKVSTGEMILEAVRRVQDPDVVRYALGNHDRILGLSTDPLLRFQKITLSPVDGYVLSRVDGTLSAREVIQLISMPAEETQRSLFGLLCTGVIEYLPGPPKPAPRPARQTRRAAPPTPAATARPAERPPEPPPAAKPPQEDEGREATESRRREIVERFDTLRSTNHFEVLGVPRTANDAQVKEAYFRLARRFHPDTHHDPHLSDLRNKIEAVFIRLGLAYEVLRNPKTRASYEADLNARSPRPLPAPPSPSAAAAPAEPPPVDPAYEVRTAEESIRRAEKRLAEEKYWDAIQLLEPAVQKVSGKILQRGRILLAKAYLKNPHWVKRAEEQLQDVVRDEPRNVEALYVLGTIYKGSGLKSRALSMFRKVLEIKPDHEQAQAELGALTPEPPGPPKEGGLLKKLFGKNE